jgi:hypothetical protein
MHPCPSGREERCRRGGPECTNKKRRRSPVPNSQPAVLAGKFPYRPHYSVSTDRNICLTKEAVMENRKFIPGPVRRRLTTTAVVAWSFFLVACFYAKGDGHAAPETDRCETEAPGPETDIFTVQGKRVKIIADDAYVCKNGRWVFKEKLVREGIRHIDIKRTAQGCEAINTRTGEKQPLRSDFSSGFEASSFLDLFGVDGWTITTLLSPKADSVPKYVQLNKELMKGGNFRDNRIDLVQDNVYSGNYAVRFSAVRPGRGMVTSKSLLEKNNLCFAKGDHLWFSGWYYLEKGVPSTLVDFETRRLNQGPGIRLFIREKKYVSMELKFAHKPQYNQTRVALPVGKWVHIKLHLWLSNREDGIIEAWQDGEKILSTKGQTLPTHDTIYNSMEVGITATTMETVLIVDDVAVSREPL